MTNLFARYNTIKEAELNTQATTTKAANAELHDLLEAERGLRRDAEAELRPFHEYVEHADAIAAQAAADAAAARDAAAPVDAMDDIE